MLSLVIPKIWVSAYLCAYLWKMCLSFLPSHSSESEREVLLLPNAFVLLSLCHMACLLYLQHTKVRAVVWARERERERERECQMEKCHCSHISIRRAAAAAHWQMGIPQKCEALVIWEITEHHQPSSPLRGLLIGEPGKKSKCSFFLLNSSAILLWHKREWSKCPEFTSLLNECTVAEIIQWAWGVR